MDSFSEPHMVEDPPYVVEVPILLDYAAPPPPRVWTVFAVYGVVLLVALTASLPVFAVLFLQRLQPNMNEKDMQRAMETLVEHDIYRPIPFMAILLLTQGGVLAVTLTAAWFSRHRLCERLGMTRSTLPVWAYPFVMISGPFVAIPGSLLLDWLGLHGDRTFLKVFAQVNPAEAALIMLLMSVLPGLAEEMLFRGYMQRRLLERWSPAWAIATTTVLFALMHMHPYSVLAILPIGAWLGVVAWRTGSIWPCVACHVFNNFLAAVQLLGTTQWGWPEDTPLAVQIALLSVGGVSFLIALWAVVKAGRIVPPGEQLLTNHEILPCDRP